MKAKKNYSFRIRVDSEVNDAVRKYAADKNLSISNAIRMALYQFLIATGRIDPEKDL